MIQQIDIHTPQQLSNIKLASLTKIYHFHLWIFNLWNMIDY